MRKSAARVNTSWSQDTILEFLESKAGVPVSREALAQVVWQEQLRLNGRLPKTWRTMLAQEIAALRRSRVDMRSKVVTIHGVGFMFTGRRIVRQK